MTIGTRAAKPPAGVITAAVLVVAGFVSRLLEPSGYGDFDETIYAQTILLWLHGVAPYHENFFSQGPLFLLLIGPFALLPGPPLEAMQLGVTLWGALGLIAGAVLGYRLAGGWGSAVSTAVLAASPLLTNIDSHVVAEGPAITLAMLSLAIAWPRSRPVQRAAVAGALMGGSLAVKALMPVAAIPLLGRLLTSGLPMRRRAGLLLALGLGVLLMTGLTVLPFEPRAVFDQTVTYRLEARRTTVEAPGELLVDIRWGMRDDLGSLAAATIGTIALLRASRGMSTLLIAWLAGTFIMLALHHPLFPRHSAALLPPLAMLASGVGLAGAASRNSRSARNLASLTICLAVGLSIPGHIRRWSELEPAGEIAEAAMALAATSGPDRYVLTDMPAIALMADRLVVPDVVDLSSVRIDAGRVTTETVAAQTDRYRPDAIMFWLSRLDSGPLEAYPDTIHDRYTRVWQKREWQSLWVREDATTFDTSAIPGLNRLEDSSFEGLISARAVSHNGQVRSGEPWRLRVLWELTGSPASLDSAHLELVSTDGVLIASAVMPFSHEKPITLWPPAARRMVEYEMPVPVGLQPTRATPRLRILNPVGEALEILSESRQPGQTWLELPRIQIVRGSSAR